MSNPSEPRYVRGRQPVVTADEWEAHMAKQQARLDRARAVHHRGVEALKRLLHLAETRDSGQIQRIALFIGACWNGRRHFDFFDFRSLDEDIGTDMLTVLDAHRYGLADIENMFPGARDQIIGVLKRWGMYGEGQTGQPLV